MLLHVLVAGSMWLMYARVDISTVPTTIPALNRDRLPNEAERGQNDICRHRKLH